MDLWRYDFSWINKHEITSDFEIHRSKHLVIRRTYNKLTSSAAYTNSTNVLRSISCFIPHTLLQISLYIFLLIAATQRVETYLVWVVLLPNNRNVSCGRWFYCIFLICSKLVALLPTIQQEFVLLSWTILISFLQGGCTRCAFHITATGRHPRQFIHLAQIIQHKTAYLSALG